MLKPFDRCRRESTLFQFTTRRLRDFIDPDHLLIQIDGQFDFGKLAAPLEERYCPDNGRPAVHPEDMIRALLISSFRRLSSAPHCPLCGLPGRHTVRWFPLSPNPPKGKRLGLGTRD